MSRVAAYQKFRNRLLSGELSPGQFVTQKELAQLAGVPIGTAREAIQKLEHESLLKVHPQRGIQITDITTKFIREAYGLRMVLEQQAVQKFATGEFAETINQLLDTTRAVHDAALDNSSDAILERAVEVDWDMHDKIVACMGNDLLSETYQVNAARLRLIRVNNHLSYKRAIAALGEHLEILELCKAGNAAQASLRLEHHIDTAMHRALQGK